MHVLYNLRRQGFNSFIHLDDEDLGDENKQIGPLTYEVGLMHFILNFKMLVRVFDEHA